MSHWLIRADAPSVSVDLPKKSCVIESRRRPRIAAHDVLVLLKRTSAGATFSSSAEVTHVATTDSGEVGGLRQTKIETGDWISLPDDSTVEVLRFSLTIVHNLRNPQHHFRGGYRRLPREDFDTIRSGEAFVARTTYFELLGALPEDLRNQFRAGELLSSSFELGQPTFEARLHRLCKFLSMRVLSVGKLLEQLSDVLERAELRDERGRSYAHQFFDDDGLTGRGDDIEKQAAVFRDLADALGEQEIAHEEGQPVRRDTLSTVLTEIQTKDRLPRESLFELLFRGRGDDL